MVVTACLRWFAFAAMLSLLLIYFKGGTSLLRDIRQSVRSTGSYYSTVLILLMFPIGLVIMTIQFLVCLGYLQAQLLLNEPWVVLAGMLLTVMAVSVSYWFRFRYLKNAWDGQVVVYANQQVVDSGPYRVVRHPLYAASLGIYLGISLAFAIWWNWVACALMLVGYILLTGYEDSFLTRKLPGYTAYRARVRYRLIPGIW